MGQITQGLVDGGEDLERYSAVTDDPQFSDLKQLLYHALGFCQSGISLNQAQW